MPPRSTCLRAPEASAHPQAAFPPSQGTISPLQRTATHHTGGGRGAGGSEHTEGSEPRSLPLRSVPGRDSVVTSTPEAHVTHKLQNRRQLRGSAYSSTQVCIRGLEWACAAECAYSSTLKQAVKLCTEYLVAPARQSHMGMEATAAVSGQRSP